MSSNEFRIEEKSSALVMTLPSVISSNSANELEKNIKMCLLKKPDLHVLDFENVLEFDRANFKYVIEYKKNLDKVGKTLASINMSPMVRREISANGLNKVFNPIASLNEAFCLAGIIVEKSIKIKLDTKFINPFIEATMFTFKTQIGIELSAGKPTLKKEHAKSDQI
ncbi:MAG: hypothetical protein KDD40_06825, partial [Bdellovibrionales bacterium]|nr:hypothetical protein [Bdellovibrionales bacterium]